ncbi:hypothetical protein PVAND_014819 [Polypedilum vanderplanki]|uniref:Calpain catalytic domain-containing protein n=1 Tax=Polypedilum vanderplanki TaxID=319348 RepID=A0A9J6BAB3_POLVA|nr:hypothetical protein PVAND_014819 [Polypedilum vanderplanki]
MITHCNTKPIPFKNQNFHAIKNDCITTGRLFHDDQFFWSRDIKNKYKLLRPSEIFKNPKFFVNGHCRFDTNQGRLGNCWFIAALGNLAMHPKLFAKVVCEDNGDFDEERYCGVFHFRFWQQGTWVDVVIDDVLPTYNGSLVFMKSSEKNEFWSALIEKAYAKLYGGYENLEGGFCAFALTDFTGGVSESYDLNVPKLNLFEMMLKSFNRKALMNCDILSPSKSAFGLVSGHAYAITNVTTITTKNYINVQLIRVRNPWGSSAEWEGNWSDNSKCWDNVSETEKAKVDYMKKGNGEFYISFSDFLKHFDILEICNVTADLIDHDPRADREWRMMSFTGQVNNSFHKFELIDPDEDDDEDFCTVVIALMHLREERTEFKRIGFIVLSEDGKVVGSEQYKRRLREITVRYNLKPGKYSIQANGEQNLKYLIRIFYEILKNKKESKSVSVQKETFERFTVVTVPNITIPSEANNRNALQSVPRNVQRRSRRGFTFKEFFLDLCFCLFLAFVIYSLLIFIYILFKYK